MRMTVRGKKLAELSREKMCGVNKNVYAAILPLARRAAESACTARKHSRALPLRMLSQASLESVARHECGRSHQSVSSLEAIKRCKHVLRFRPRYLGLCNHRETSKKMCRK